MQQLPESKTACKGSENPVFDHFADVGKMANICSVTERKISDIKLSRFYCMNEIDAKPDCRWNRAMNMINQVA